MRIFFVKSQNSRNEVSVVTLKVSPPGDETFRARTVLEGERYVLRADVMDNDREWLLLSLLFD